MPKREITWLVRYVDKGIFTARTFQTEEAAEAFIRRIRNDPNQEFRRTEVWTDDPAPAGGGRVG